MRLAIVLAIAAAAAAQTPAPAGGWVTGRFIDADTGQPIPNYSPDGPDVYVKADGEGRFRVGSLPPGPQLVRFAGWPSWVSAWVTVAAGEETGGLEIRVRQNGRISGHVTDENKDPIPDMHVCAMVREYMGGGLYTYPWQCVTSDDRGEYRLDRVLAGRVTYLLAEKPRSDSSVPQNPDLRAPAYQTTYYPNTATSDGASPVILRSGEVRDHMDIQVRRSPQYCVEAIATNNGAPSSLSIKLTDEGAATSNMIPGSSSSGPARASSGPDGKVRLCGLFPGQFRLAAFTSGMNPTAFGATSFTVDKEDVRGIRVNAVPPTPLQGETVWDAPDPLSVVSISARTVTNDALMAQREHPGPQGQFTLSLFPSLDYVLEPTLAASAGAYVKDLACGGQSVLHRWLRPGAAAGDARLRIALANDGGFVAVASTQQNGAVAGNTTFLILPESAAIEGVLADAMVVGHTGPSGDFKSPVLPPGKYYVLATYDLVDKSPETIAAIVRAKGHAKEVEVAPRATAAVTVEPVAIFERP